MFQCFEAWVSLGSFTAEELSSTVLLPSLFQVSMVFGFSVGNPYSRAV